MPRARCILGATMAGLREFQFHERLGRGGFGEVYRTTMRADGEERDVAVKLLHHAVGEQHQAVERLRDEARILGRVAHPGVPTPHGITRLDGRVALVVEFIEGLDVHDLTPMPAGTAMLLMERVANTLHSAYVTVVDGEPINVVHRDVKPSNIRIGFDGRVKLLDFGIARMDGEDREAETSTDNMLGSVAYLAPERLLHGSSEPAQDVYALGATLFEVMTGRRLFSSSLRETYVALADPENQVAHLDEVFAEVDLPEPVVTLLRRMLAYNPWQRPNAHTVSCDAHRIAEQLGGPDLGAFMASRQAGHKGAGQLSGKVLREVRRASLITNPSFGGEPKTVLYGADRPRPTSVPDTFGGADLSRPSTRPGTSSGMPQGLMYLGMFLVFLLFLALLGATVFAVVFALA